MAFIPSIPYAEAKGLLKELYRRNREEDGKVGSIVRVHSLNPPTLERHLQYHAQLMRGPSPLTRVQKEMIAVAVSSANGCFY